ncbi:MAG: ABC transporter substrate-binding protein [Anaerolineae bacterium]|nr:ABC transporter substrate-binding protein [Anaerolineae bacterium]
MRKYRFIFTLLCVAALVLPVSVSAQDTMSDMIMGQDMVSACPTPSNLPETVTVGAVFTLSGAASVYGISQQNAVNLAVQEINDSHYLGDSTFVVQFEDSTGAPEQAINAMTKLVEEDHVVAVIGPTLSSEAVAADPVANDAGVPILGVSNTATALREALGEFYHRDSLPEAVVIPGTISQAKDILGLENVAVLYGNDDDFTISGYDVFIQALADNGINVVDEQTFAKGDVDFNAQLTAALSSNPDALVVSALAAEAVQIINQARQQGYAGPIIGGNGFNSPAVLNQAGENAEGLIVGGAWNAGNPNPSESSVQFMQAFQDTYDVAPDQFAAQAYTGAWLVATAIRCADSVDGAAVNTAIGEISGMETPLGAFSFDESGEPLHDPIAQIVIGGKFAPLATAMAEAQ